MNLIGLLAGLPADFGKLIAEETDNWAQVIRTANIKPDDAIVPIEVFPNTRWAMAVWSAAGRGNPGESRDRRTSRDDIQCRARCPYGNQDALTSTAKRLMLLRWAISAG